MTHPKGGGHWWNHKGSLDATKGRKNTALTQSIPPSLIAQMGRGPGPIQWAEADTFGAIIAQFEVAPGPGEPMTRGPLIGRSRHKISWFWSPMAVLGATALVAIWWVFGLVCFHDAALAPWARLLGGVGFLVSGLVPLSLYVFDPLWIKDGRLYFSLKDSISLREVRGVKLVCDPLSRLAVPRHVPLLILEPGRGEPVAVRTLASLWWDVSPSKGSVRRAKRLAAWLQVPYNGVC
jgi:hypothetical protein